MKKLVRNRIPSLLTEIDKKQYKFETASPIEYWRFLKEKLVEEAKEFKEDENEEELADLFEVIEAILQAKGWSLEKIKNIQNRKRLERGDFSDKVILEKLIERQDS